MRNGWEIKKINEICDVVTGKWDANHAEEKGLYRIYTCAKDYVFCNTKRFSGECLILPGNGVNVGDVYYYDGEFDAYQRTYVLSDLKASTRYVYYHMLLCWKERNLNKQFGSATNFIKMGNFSDYEIPLPPLPEQQRIVSMLDEAFESIAQAKANAQRNLVNARELFESYLQDIFENKVDDWENKMLQDVVDANCTLSYGIVQPGEEYPKGLPLVRPTDLTNKVVTLDGLKRIDPRLADSYKRTSLTGDELLLCVRGSTGVVSITSKELKGANVTRGIVPIRFNSELINQEFGYYLLISGYVQKQIKEKTYGTALMQINIGDLREILMPFPPLAEQLLIISRLDALSTETKRLEEIYKHKIESLDELKKSVLSKAFNGEL